MASAFRSYFSARSASHRGGNVSLHCNETGCRVFGTTIPVSVPIGGEMVKSFSAHLPQGVDRGLVAVAVYRQNGGWWDGCVLEVTRDTGGTAHVNLDQSWLPIGTQLVHVDGDGILVTDAETGERFAQSKLFAKRLGCGQVPDGDLLMRCLAGLATLDNVRAAAITCADGEVRA